MRTITKEYIEARIVELKEELRLNNKCYENGYTQLRAEYIHGQIDELKRMLELE